MANIDTHGSNEEEWIGFDLDGTLAKYDGWKGIDRIGEPVPAMLILAYALHRFGHKIKIFTARVAPRDGDDGSKARKFVEKWCKEFLGFIPEITHVKDASMVALLDDRACAVEQNTGKILGGWSDFIPKASDKAKSVVSGMCKREKKATAEDDLITDYNEAIKMLIPKLKDWEGGFIPDAHYDTVGKVHDIGYGFTQIKDPVTGKMRPVRVGDKITREQADTRLNLDIRRLAARMHVLYPWMRKLDRKSKAAALSIGWNAGAGIFSKDLSPNFNRKIAVPGADPNKVFWEEQGTYTSSGGKKNVKGLVNRRAKERKAFYTPPPIIQLLQKTAP